VARFSSSNKIIHADGLLAILVEYNFKMVLGVTDRVAIIEPGCVIHRADSAALKSYPPLPENNLGVADTAPRRMAKTKRR
jgi:ABC-type branched-subunit amino acid transport system ATPase component